MNKVALIIPYFGKWPEWINLYLYSCSRQKNIDFLFFTDCEVPEKTYPNTIFRQITFADYCSLVSNRLGFEFRPKKVYKLCDLKPFYGVVHEADLKDYEWWGFGDLDLVYGDLSLLLSECNLRKYDLLTTHTDRVAGHFTVMRKASRYTRLCFDIHDWQGKLCDQRHLGIDESYFSSVVMPAYYKLALRVYRKIIGRLTSSSSRFYWVEKFARCMSLIKSPVRMREYFTTFVPAPDAVCTYNLQTGEIECPRQQVTKIGECKLYLHFLFFKKTPYLQTEHYWRSGFWHVPQDYDFSNGGIVEISTEGISIRNN